jgi:DNA polymerase-3 subunit gamma/tau
MSGAALDLHEIDGASNRGIQEVRELKDKIKYLPTSSRYKTIIIDEVHMLTTEAFNALLKTLEEPPPHVYFIFATTELHKIPITILSRCQRYELQRVGSDLLAAHLLDLARKEDVEIGKGALNLIVREAEGSVRDGLSLLDQVLSYGESPIEASDVVEVLGLVDREVLVSITRALLDGDRQSALANLSETFRFGMDIKRFLADLLACFRALLLIKIKGCDQLLDLPEGELQSFREIAAEHSPESIHQKLNLLMQTAEDIRYSFQPQLTLETSFLSIIEAGNVVGLSQLLSQIDTAIGALPEQPVETSSAEELSDIEPPADQGKKKFLEPEPTGQDGPAAQPAAVEPAKELLPDSAPEEPPPITEELVGQGAAGTEPPPVEEAPPIEEASEPAEAVLERKRDVRKDWLDFVAYVKSRKQWMAQNLQQANSAKEKGQELILEFDEPAECALLKTKENRQILTEYVLDFFQKSYIIHVVSPDDVDDPGQKDSEGPKKRRQQLAANPLVRMTEEIFNGQVGDIRIGPNSR